MSNSPERWTVEAAKSLHQKQNQHQQEQQHPVSAGNLAAQQHHKKHNFQPTDKSSYEHNSQERQQASNKVPSQTSETWVSPELQDDYSKPLLLSSQSCQEPQHHSSAGVASKNVSYEEFIMREEEEMSASLDPETGFPKCWPKVSRPPPPVEQPSPAKGFSLKEKASPQNVPKPVAPPSPPTAKVAPPQVDQPSRPSKTVLLPSPPSSAKVAAPPVEQPPPAKAFPPRATEKASPQNVPRTVPPPSRCRCIIL